MNTPDTTRHSNLPLTRKILVLLLVIALALIATTGKKALRDKEQQINLQAKKIEAAEAQIAALEKEKLSTTNANLRPRTFTVLPSGVEKIVFDGFEGELRWFTTGEPVPSNIQTDYYQPPGTNTVPVVIKSADGPMEIRVPSGAKAYSIQGTVSGKSWSAEFHRR